MTLTEGAKNILQAGGAYKRLKDMSKGRGYEAHHMPPKSIFDIDEDKFPCILLTHEDHLSTSSYGGRMNIRHTGAYLPPATDKKTGIPYSSLLGESLEQGSFSELVRDEILEIKMKFQDKYDGALKQYISEMKNYVKTYGIPKRK